jgi:hypothetical protein
MDRLGEYEVYRVVRCKVLAQFPRPSCEIDMPVPNDPQQSQVFDRLLRTLCNDLTRTDESPQCAEDLHVKEMRRVEVIIVSVNTPLDMVPKLRLEQ